MEQVDRTPLSNNLLASDEEGCITKDDPHAIEFEETFGLSYSKDNCELVQHHKRIQNCSFAVMFGLKNGKFGHIHCRGYCSTTNMHQMLKSLMKMPVSQWILSIGIEGGSVPRKGWMLNGKIVKILAMRYLTYKTYPLAILTWKRPLHLSVSPPTLKIPSKYITSALHM